MSNYNSSKNKKSDNDKKSYDFKYDKDDDRKSGSKYDKDDDKRYGKDRNDGDDDRKSNSKYDRDDDRKSYEYKNGKDHDHDDDDGHEHNGKGKGHDYHKGYGYGHHDRDDDDDDDDHGHGHDDDDDHWPGSNNCAAKDDSFSVTLDDAPIALNVLANDPGSANIWSLDQDAETGGRCPQVPQDLSSVTLASGAVISLNPDGTLNYQPGPDQQQLPAGTTFTDTFSYIIRMANGTISQADVTVVLTGTYEEDPNTPAVFSGSATGSVQEDAALVTSGLLAVQDDDAGEAVFASTGALQGTYGNFSFDLATGVWSYTLANGNENVQALNTGDSVQEQLQVFSADGSSTFITVDIAGDDDVPPDEPGAIWVMSKVDISREDVLHTEISFVGSSGLAFVTGFADNDVMHHTGLVFREAQEADFDGDNVLDTLLQFEFFQGPGTAVVDVLLVGFDGFSAAQHLYADPIPF